MVSNEGDEFVNLLCKNCLQPLEAEFRAVSPGTSDSGYVVESCKYCYFTGDAITEVREDQEAVTFLEIIKSILYQAETYCSKEHVKAVREVLESNGILESYLYLADKGDE